MNILQKVKKYSKFDKVLIGAFMSFGLSILFAEGANAIMTLIAIPVIGVLLFLSSRHKSLLPLILLAIFWTIIIALLISALQVSNLVIFTLADLLIFLHYTLIVYSIVLLTKEKKGLLK